MAWIPNNINAPSANRERGDDNVFRFKKKAKKKTAQTIKGFTEIKKLK
jgi:hypothetical protein